jgi:hypothetical protein
LDVFLFITGSMTKGKLGVFLITSSLTNGKLNVFLLNYYEWKIGGFLFITSSMTKGKLGVLLITSSSLTNGKLDAFQLFIQ